MQDARWKKPLITAHLFPVEKPLAGGLNDHLSSSISISAESRFRFQPQTRG
jgi:hypothetical protein